MTIREFFRRFFVFISIDFGMEQNRLNPVQDLEEEDVMYSDLIQWQE